MVLRNFLLLCLIVGCTLAERKGRDSYLDALKESHLTSAKPVKKLLASNPNDRESKVTFDGNGLPDGQVYPVYTPSPAYGNPNQEYGPPKPDYGPPKPEYGPPKPEYGLPKPEYGAPAMKWNPIPQYGPPAPQYGPPQPPIYGPPPQYGPPQAPIPSYGLTMPDFNVGHAFLGLLDKIHLKLDIYSILKVMLKLVIFKKIVSFIAILFLLLFIPKFKTNKEEDEDESDARGMSNKFRVDERLNNLTHYVVSAIDDYKHKIGSDECDTIYCQSKQMLNEVNNKFSYQRLLQWYSQESR